MPWMAALGYRASKGTEELWKVLEQERTWSVSGFTKASVAAGSSREDDTVRIQREVFGAWRRALHQRSENRCHGGLQGLDQPGLGDGSTWSWPSGGTAVSLASWGRWEEIWVGWAPTQRCPLGTPERWQCPSKSCRAACQARCGAVRMMCSEPRTARRYLLSHLPDLLLTCQAPLFLRCLSPQEWISSTPSHAAEHRPWWILSPWMVASSQPFPGQSRSSRQPEPSISPGPSFSFPKLRPGEESYHGQPHSACHPHGGPSSSLFLPAEQCIWFFIKPINK